MVIFIKEVRPCPGLSLRAGGWGFPSATMNVVPGYFHWKIEEKEPIEVPSCLIPRLLVVFTQQLEILVTTLAVPNAKC